MKKQQLEELKGYIGQKVKAVKRHVTEQSVIEGVLDKVEKNGIFIKVGEPTTARDGCWDSGKRYINKSHLVLVRTLDGKVFE